MIPHWKVEVDGDALTDHSLSATVVRPINAISYATLIANDEKGANYLENIDLFSNIDIYMGWTSSPTKQLSGVVEDVGPELSPDGGQVLTAKARGLGRALLLTHCNKTYGKESQNPTLEDPDEIWADLIDNYVNLSFGDALAPTGYSIDKSINARVTPDMNFLNSAYKSNFDLICEVLLTRQAEEGHSQPSDQFYVDTSGTFRLKGIDENQTGWSRYWNSTTSIQTITEGDTILFSNFHKTMQDFGNKIIYCGMLRKPGWDYWCTNGQTNSLWGSSGVTLFDDPTGPPTPLVGANSLRATPTGLNQACRFYLPATGGKAWNFNNIGSMQNPPTLNFQICLSFKYASLALAIYLFKTRTTEYYTYVDTATAENVQDLIPIDGTQNRFQYLSIPIGPYHDYPDQNNRHWVASGGWGAPSWSEINGIEFYWFNGPSTTTIIWLDDPHFNGHIVRCAYNPTSIAGPAKEVQRVIIDDAAHDDTMDESDDSGMCARLAKAELMRCQTTPVVGTVTFAVGIENMLPGQVLHLHGRQQENGDYRINHDFRITKVTHIYDKQGFMTSIDVTSDILTSFPKTVPEQASIISQYALMGHKQAKNLKAAGIDVLVPMLSVPYPS